MRQFLQEWQILCKHVFFAYNQGVLWHTTWIVLNSFESFAKLTKSALNGAEHLMLIPNMIYDERKSLLYAADVTYQWILYVRSWLDGIYFSPFVRDNEEAGSLNVVSVFLQT